MENGLIAIAILLLYLLPTAVGVQRKHRSVGAIAFVNIVFGWTAFGWVWAMIWSLTGNVHEAAREPVAVKPSGGTAQHAEPATDSNTLAVVFVVGLVLVVVFTAYVMTAR